jgi:hypothetical protein
MREISAGVVAFLVGTNIPKYPEAHTFIDFDYFYMNEFYNHKAVLNIYECITFCVLVEKKTLKYAELLL